MSLTQVQMADGSTVPVDINDSWTPDQIKTELTKAFGDQSPYTGHNKRIEVVKKSIAPSFPNDNPEQLDQQAATAAGYSPAMLKAASQGVDVDSGMPNSVAANPKLGFLPLNEEKKAQGVAKILSDHFGKQVQTRVGKASGVIEYLNPDTQRWTATHFTAGEIPGQVVSGVPSAIGAVGGAALGGLSGNPLVAETGANLGGAIGQTVGELGRQGIGSALGVNDNSFGEMGSDAWKSGLFAAKLGFVLQGLKAVPQLYNTITKGSPAVNVEAGKKLLADMQESQPTVDWMQQQANQSGKNFQPNIPQMANSPSGLAQYARLKTQSPFTEIDAERAKANVEGADAVLSSVSGADGRSGAAAAKDAADTIQDQTRKSAMDLENQISDAQEKFAFRMGDVSSQDQIEYTSKTRDALRALKTQALDAVKAGMERTKSYETPGNDLALDQEFLDWHKDVASTAAAPLRATWKPAEVNNSIPIIPKQPPKLSMDDTALLKEFGIDPKTPAQKIPLADINQAVRDFRLKARMSYNPSEPSNKDLLWETADQLAKLRGRALAKNPEALAAIETQDELVDNYRTKWKRGVIGDLLEYDEATNQYKMKDSQALGALLNKQDQGSWNAMMGAVSGSPEAQQRVRAMMLNDFYTNYTKMTPEGVRVPTPENMAKFLEDKGWALKGLFTPEDFGTIRTAKDLAGVIASKQAALDSFDATFRKNYGTKIENVTPEWLANRFFTTKNSTAPVARILQLKANLMAMDKELGTDTLGSWKQAVQNSLRTRIRGADSTIAQDSHASMDTLKNLIANPEHPSYIGDKLGALFGDNKMKDNLQTLYRGLEINGRSANPVTTPTGDTPFSKLGRWAFGWFGAEGRTIGAFKGMRRDAWYRLANQALTDPDYLRELVGSGQKRIDNAAFQNLMFRAGASALLQSDSYSTKNTTNPTKP